MDTFGLSVADLAKLASVTRRTAQRWKAARIIPQPYSDLLRMRLRAELGAISSSWDGWIIRRGELISPESETFSPNDLRALPYRLALIRALQADRSKWREDGILFRQFKHAADDLGDAFSVLDKAIAFARQLMSADQSSRQNLAPALCAASGLRPHEVSDEACPTRFSRALR